MSDKEFAPTAPSVPDNTSALTPRIEPKLGKLGSYKLLGLISEGGMGEVYKAEQLHPVRRTVAVKLVKLGMDSKEIVARFDAERQALAMMDHPNVARVLDAGANEHGRPYFVMDYVPGIPITDFCEKHKLTTYERLELFKQACEGVHHAHQKAIIHRDLKPSNILVTVHDDKPLAKIIDFGIAKALSSRLTERTVFTEYGKMIGTPEYMSPEQAEMTAAGVDTRTDVYSLGVVLYELLTGVHPFDAKSLRTATFPEMQRILREVEPPRPSTRVTELVGAEAARVAEHRGTDVSSLCRQLRRELEWIPLMAIRKDPRERYRSVAELSDDVRNYLEHRPLIAGPQRAGYRIRKFIRKHYRSVAVAAVVLTLVLGLLALTNVSLWREYKLRVRAVAAEADMLQQKQTAERRLDDARALAQRFIAVYDKASNKSEKTAIYRQGLQAMERLAEGPPPTRQFLGNLAAGWRVLGGWEAENGNESAALTAYNRSLEVFQGLRQSQPDSRWAQFTYADVSGYASRIELLSGEYDHAITRLRQSLPVLETLLQNTTDSRMARPAGERPTETDIRIELIHHYYGLYFAQLARGDDRTTATAQRDRAVEYIESLTHCASADEAPLLLFNANMNMASTAERMAAIRSMSRPMQVQFWRIAREFYLRAKERSAQLPSWANYRAAPLSEALANCDKALANEPILPITPSAAAPTSSPVVARATTAPARALRELDEWNMQAYELRRANRLDEAAVLRAKVVATAQKLLASDDDRLMRYHLDYAALLIAMSRFEDAQAQLRVPMDVLWREGHDAALRSRAETTMRALKVNLSKGAASTRPATTRSAGR